ncbi:probable receptor-like protein kinase At1g11050 [Cornus florida]|uniref:probable receptor-like protein kinase At1g11050 n=1 Tax=Cornus florida TaxID=4283 RepID=UPI00289E14CE|nr:probable receptor-like protein kinase At1g11050 [Cornus florida]
MGKSHHFSSSILFFLLFPFLSSIDSVTSSCPIDFSYVKSFEWDTTLCREPVDANCCQTLRSLFGIGLAHHLNQTSMFYLPNAETSTSCLSDFQTKLTAVSLSPSLVPQCLNNSDDFVAKASNCAGIATIQDWIEKTGSSSNSLNPSCNGDLTGLTRCSSCLDAGMKVTSQLVALDPNATKCFYYTILYAAGVVNDFGPEDTRTANCILGLPLAISTTNKTSNHLSKTTLLKWVFGFLGALIGVVAAAGVIILYRIRDKKKKQEAFHEEYVTGVKARVLPNSGAKWFCEADLEEATNGFSQRNLIGQGGNGIVYKGTLTDGTVVAVKAMLDLDSKGDDEFANEVEIISKIRHRNLLSLRGCCVSSDASRGKRRYLVYDFMSNGSLDDHLFKHESKKQSMTWPQRKKIMLDVAKGLAYLHYGLKPAIYHRDIKATNILLDSEMKARVADFGLAKQSTEGQSHLTTRVAGTYGYLAPEYALYGQLTEKSDVYSFGIVILEVMSGRKVLDASNSSTLLITDWAWGLVKSGNVEEFFDELIREEGPRGVMERFVHVGILCAHVMVALRPTIADALRMLEGDIDIPKLPDRPLPLSHESFRSSLQYSMSMSERSRASSSIISI